MVVDHDVVRPQSRLDESCLIVRRGQGYVPPVGNLNSYCGSGLESSEYFNPPAQRSCWERGG